MKVNLKARPTVPSATSIHTKHHLVTTDRAYASCCSCRAVCCVVRIVTIPDTWHLKDGTYISAQQVLDRLAGFAPALRALEGGLTISGGEPMVQLAFTKQILAGAKKMGLHTAIETSGFLGDRVDEFVSLGARSRSSRHQKLKS